MQRVRIGLTGLAFVFILALLGAIFSRASDEEPITPNLIATKGASAEAAEEELPKEPLAELGVAPGNADADTDADANASDNEAAPGEAR